MSGEAVKQSEADEAEQVEEVKAEPSSGIVSFAVKACIIGIVFSACVIFIANYVIDDVRESFHGLEGRAFWTKVEKELDRAADPGTDLPPAKKQKIVHDLRVIVARWRPLLDAVQEGLSKPAEPAAPPAAPTPHP